MEEINTFRPSATTTNCEEQLTYCLLCNISLSLYINSTSGQMSQEMGLGHPSSATIVVKVEPEYDTYENLQIEDQESFSSNTNLDHELKRFVQKQFTIVHQISDLQQHFRFCESCLNQLIQLQDLHLKLVLLQNEYQKLQEVIAAGFNSTYLNRKAATQTAQQLNQDNIPVVKIVSLASPVNETDYNSEPDSDWNQSPMTDSDYSVPSSSKQKKGHLSARIRTVKAKAKTQFKNCYNIRTKEVKLGKDEHNMLSQLLPCSVRLVRIPNDIFVAPKISKVKKDRNTKGGPFKCEICSKLFNRRNNLALHLRIHSGVKPCECQYCHRRFYKGSNLKRHLLTHTKIRNHSCHLCGSLFAVKHELTTHFAYKHKLIDNPIHCKLCSKQFLRPSELKTHVEKEHAEGQIGEERKVKQAAKKEVKAKPKNKFQCDGCSDLNFTSQESLKAHRFTQHNIGSNGDGLFRCLRCNAIFVVQNNYDLHCSTCQEKSVCGICEMSFDSIKLLQEHSNKDHRTRCHQCEVCGQGFYDRIGMMRHKRVQHDGERPFQCSVCDLKFTTNACLKLHMVQHTGKKLYGCTYCDDRFNYLLRRREHMVKVHPEHLINKPFICQICFNIFEQESELDKHRTDIHTKSTCSECSRTFKDMQKYRRHLLIHSGEKPFQCTYCPKSFNKNVNLIEHVFRHTGERPHKCDQCAQGFIRKIELERHYAREHSTMSTTLIPEGNDIDQFDCQELQNIMVLL